MCLRVEKNTQRYQSWSQSLRIRSAGFFSRHLSGAEGQIRTKKLCRGVSLTLYEELKVGRDFMHVCILSMQRSHSLS